MTVMIQDYGGHDHAAGDKALGRFLRPDLCQPGPQYGNNQHAEEGADHRLPGAFSSIKPISARADRQTIFAVMIKPKPIT